MEDTLSWNCEMEVNLFHALRGHKPVGVNRYFHMLSIHERMASSYKKITTKQIWDHLKELYNLNALNESEILPFPNKEEEFTLPDFIYGDLMAESFPRLVKHKSDTSKPDKDKEEKTEPVSAKSIKVEPKHAMNTPDNSPKRKRTRQTPSNASPATPDAPPHKRRR